MLAITFIGLLVTHSIPSRSLGEFVGRSVGLWPLSLVDCSFVQSLGWSLVRSLGPMVGQSFSRLVQFFG